MGGGAVVAVMAAQKQARMRVLDAFRLAGATAPERAQPIDQLGLTRNSALLELERQGVIKTAGGGRVYLDEAAYVAVRDRQPTRAVRVLAVVLAVVLVILLGVTIALTRSSGR